MPEDDETPIIDFLDKYAADLFKLTIIIGLPLLAGIFGEREYALYTFVIIITGWVIYKRD